MNGGAVPEIPKPPTVYFHSWPGETILSSPAAGATGTLAGESQSPADDQPFVRGDADYGFVRRSQ